MLIEIVKFIHSLIINAFLCHSFCFSYAIDWMPTLMGLATDGEWKGGYTGATLDGYDIWGPITTGEASPRDEILHYHDGSMASITVGDYTLNKYTTPPPPVVDYDWKFEEDLHPEYAHQSCDDPSLIHGGYASMKQSPGTSGSSSSAGSSTLSEAADTASSTSGKRSVFSMLSSWFMGLVGAILMVIIIQVVFKQKEDESKTAESRLPEVDETTRLI